MKLGRALLLLLLLLAFPALAQVDQHGQVTAIQSCVGAGCSFIAACQFDPADVTPEFAVCDSGGKVLDVTGGNLTLTGTDSTTLIDSGSGKVTVTKTAGTFATLFQLDNNQNVAFVLNNTTTGFNWRMETGGGSGERFSWQEASDGPVEMQLTQNGDLTAGGIILGQANGGAAPPSTCTPYTIFVDTDETVDTNCVTTNDNSLCLCIATNTWVALENN